MLKLTSLIRSVALWLSILTIATIGIAQAQEKSNTEQAVPTPAFSLLDTTDVEHSLSNYRGKVVMLNFWATWCKPCVEELPSMNALREHFADQPFEIIAINIGDSKQTINTYLTKHELKLNFPVLLDQDGSVANLYQVRPIPATMLIDKAGNFVYGELGFQDWNSEQSISRIEKIFEL